MPSLIVIVVTSFTLKIVLILAPFMFFALLYGWFKNMFSQWLSLFLSNILTVLIVTLVLNAVIEQMEKFINTLDSHVGVTEILVIGVQMVIFGIILSVLINIAKAIAEKIATVSMEAVGQSGLGQPLAGFNKFGGRVATKMQGKGSKG